MAGLVPAMAKIGTPPISKPTNPALAENVANFGFGTLGLSPFICGSDLWQPLYLTNKACEQGEGIVAPPRQSEPHWQVQIDHGQDGNGSRTSPPRAFKNPSDAQAGRHETKDCRLV
jgi:hypothetical protein